MKNRIIELNNEINDINIWQDAKNAQNKLKEKTKLEKLVFDICELENNLQSSKELLEIAIKDSEDELLNEVERDINSLEKISINKEIECLFSGENDDNDCFMEINAGAGGTESNDWATMLMKMYLRWCESHNFKTEIVDQIYGEEAGIKSATIKITGNLAFGWAKTESGVHRLVRISPFDANARRHTSFASVWVYPAVENNIDIKILNDDIRIDTYRASGPGGQHVNKTESAVRITHIPTGIVVQSQNNRSQHKNKEYCINVLKSKLYALELQNKQQSQKSSSFEKLDISWGSQIRSYVLQPYQMIKDLRTGIETSNTTAVLEGDIDSFILAALSNKDTAK